MLKRAQAGRPGKSRSSALGDEASDVHARIARPDAEPLQSLLWMSLQVGPNAVLRAEPLRELVLSAHRGLEMIESVAGYVAHVRQVVERSHAVSLSLRQRRSK